jgi:hypothetical protein
MVLCKSDRMISENSGEFGETVPIRIMNRSYDTDALESNKSPTQTII